MLQLPDMCFPGFTTFSVRREVCDPPAGEVSCIKLGEPVLSSLWGFCVESGAEVHKPDPSIGRCCVQVLSMTANWPRRP